MNKQIGKVTKKIIKILELEYDKEEPIFIGDANLNHMKEKHPEDFAKYVSQLENILKKSNIFSKKRKEKVN